jgi:hypothetical protein
MCSNDDFLALRNDITNMRDELKSFMAAMSPEHITTVISTNFIAQWSSLEDRLLQKLSKTTKTVAKNTKTVAVINDNESKTKQVSKKLVHPNYPEIRETAWLSSRMYCLNLKKSYSEHLQEIIPADIWEKASNDESVINVSKNGTIHAKSKTFVAAVLKLGGSDKMLALVDIDRVKENEVRNKGAFNHVGNEKQTTEEAEADAEEKGGEPGEDDNDDDN